MAGFSLCHRPSRADVRRAIIVQLASGLCLSAVIGCGLPTWTELIGGSQEDNEPKFVPPAQPPQVIPTTKPAPPKPPPKPEEIVAKFQELKPFQIDDQALGSILSLDEGLDAVTELDLKGSQVTNEGVANIGKLTHLTKLDVSDSKIDKEGFAAIAQATSLEEFRINGSKIDEGGLTALRPLSNLKIMDLRGAKLSHAGFAELLHHRQIVELDLRSSSMDDLSLDIVADLPDLERLTLAHTRVTDAGISRLTKLDKLTYLDLYGCNVTGQGFAPIAKNKGLKSLKTLVLAATPMNLDGAKAVMQMKNLDNLALSYQSSMQDVHLFQMIKDMDELTQLHLTNCSSLTSAAMAAVKGHKKLEYLDLSNCPRIDDTVFNHLMTCKNLKKVILSGTNCSAVNANKFKILLPQCELVGVQGT